MANSVNTKWEYFTMVPSFGLTYITVDQLDAMGAQGWEVVSVEGISALGVQAVFLKRPVER